MTEPTGWTEDHIRITGLYALGHTATWSLCGRLGSTFMESMWGHPTSLEMAHRTSRR